MDNLDDILTRAIAAERKRILDWVGVDFDSTDKRLREILFKKGRRCEWDTYGRCCADSGTNRFCKEHDKEVCCVCSEKATHGCDYCGQFVCGAPLCDKCTYTNDLSKPSGNWGFMNHIHISKVNNND